MAAPSPLEVADLGERIFDQFVLGNITDSLDLLPTNGETAAAVVANLATSVMLRGDHDETDRFIRFAAALGRRASSWRDS